MKHTTDLWFASYLRSLGVELADFEKIAAHKGKYSFEATEADWKQYKLGYMKSDCAKMRQLQDELKALLY